METYYYHTTLATLSQDDLYNILFFGGLVSLVLFAVALAALTMHFVKKIDEHRGESIFGIIGGTFLKILFWSVMYLMFILVLYTLYIYAVGSGYSLSVAESIEWFFRTDWIGRLSELVTTLDRIREYGEDAERIAKDVVISIYVVRLAFTAVLFGFTLTVIVTMMLKINKLVNAQAVNSVEYASTLAVSGFAGIFVVSMVVGMINLTISEIFAVSDDFAGTSVSSSPVKIEMVYLDVLNPHILFSNSTTETNNDPLNTI